MDRDIRKRQEKEIASYEDMVSYIEEIPKFTEKPSPEHTRSFLRELGEPCKDKRIVHVAGTNGKGSVCAYIQAILRAQGKRTGLFTSPHLVSINERIRINNEKISEEEFEAVFREVKEAADRLLEEGVSHPSYFEFLFLMGMRAFQRAEAEYVILEAGLGGRLDATNAVLKPKASVITSISLDHTERLGNTIEEIAGEKAGIIKAGSALIFDGESEAASGVIRKRARELGAECREITKNAYEIREITDKHIDFSRTNGYDRGVIWRLAGFGAYQAMNASLALSAAEELLKGEKLHYDRWREALSGTVWEGRMEEVLPGVVIDGAHNMGGMEAFIRTLALLGGGEEERPVILFAAAKDKAYEEMISLLTSKSRAKAYVAAEIEGGRGVPADKLFEIFKRNTKAAVFAKRDIGKAFELAAGLRGGGRLYCIGSLYLAGALKAYLSEKMDKKEAGRHVGF